MEYGLLQARRALCPALTVHSFACAHFSTAHDLVSDFGQATRRRRLDRRMGIFREDPNAELVFAGYLP
ncbi:MAG: hypothetical protein FJX72_19315, partial [Armatimonadetes bacterium]|nr:hypothetical protein [Armatimonadota bacterium]